MKTFSMEVSEIAAKIGIFFFNQNNRDFAATEKSVLNLMISKIEIRNDTVVISTSRPGLLIGKKGETINQLTSFLKRKINIVEAESINDWLLSFNYGLEDNY